MTRFIQILLACVLWIQLPACNNNQDPLPPPEVGELPPPTIMIPLPGADGFIPLASTQTYPLALPLNLVTGSSNLLTMEQVCTIANPSDGCCQLGILSASSPPRLSSFRPAFDLFAHPGRLRVETIVEQNQAMDLVAYVFSDSQCRFKPPVVTSVSDAQSIVRVSGMGQLIVHTDVAMQIINEKIYFRDISRRVSPTNAVGLTATSSMAVYQFHDFQGEGIRYYPLSLVQAPVDATPTELTSGAIDGLVQTQIVYDFFKKNFAINSWDNLGSSMTVIVEIPFPLRATTSTCPGVARIERASSFNAFYNGQDNTINFTPRTAVGRDKTAMPIYTLAADLDIVAHEWGHAYLDNYADLAYNRESGALNEAFADWVAIRVTDSVGDNDWVIGSSLYFDFGDGRGAVRLPTGFRDLSVYSVYNDANWVDTTMEGCPKAELCNDYCGVHRNNRVANFAFYLLAEGNNNLSQEQRLTAVFSGIGIDKAFQIAFRANQVFWSSSSDFSAARLGMEMAAQELFPEDTSVQNAVSLAWASVRVGDVPSMMSSADGQP